MRGRALRDWLGAGENGGGVDELSGPAREVDAALGWLRAAGDLQAERWGAAVSRMTQRVDAMRSRHPGLGDPTRSLIVASFVMFARASGLRPAELAALVEVPGWLQKDLDLLRDCDTLAKSGRRRGSGAGRARRPSGHSFRLSTPTKRVDGSEHSATDYGADDA
ncbi:MAG: hypothetical protein IBJ10_01085 [Phycisphaerales bacterium]|nr:hypothetical protein [Phycisphaerales bacterium]